MAPLEVDQHQTTWQPMLFGTETRRREYQQLAPINQDPMIATFIGELIVACTRCLARSESLTETVPCDLGM